MIQLENIQKIYDGKIVVENLSLTVSDGQRIALTAPSGCGKTTLLHIIAGLLKPDAGRISGYDVSDVCMLFQEVRLFPRFTALENVMAVLKGNRKEKKEKAIQWLTKVELTAEDMGKLPDMLSGGQQQRVALARALAAECSIVLLDEPFKGLDADTKKQIYDLANKVLTGKTLVLVTHDEMDADALSCEILRFAQGMRLLEP